MTDLPRGALGRTGLEVGAALDHGITLFDSAPSYGSSEERLGRALGPLRRDVILATKGGYGVPGVPDWTGEVLRLGIEAAPTRLRTDVIDGKIRAAGYSGENHALSVAIRCGQFDVVECSVSPFDRGVLDWAIPDAAARGLGCSRSGPSRTARGGTRRRRKRRTFAATGSDRARSRSIRRRCRGPSCACGSRCSRPA